jgi:hypothetical protein
MNNKIAPLSPSLPLNAPLRTGSRRCLSLLTLALVGMSVTGCYRATGLQRTPLVAEEIPENGGDRVAGLKSAAGSGDYYLGNDFIHVAIDGTVFGDPVENVIAGAVAGGSIVDAGYVTLDTSFRRVPAPGDAMDRLTPVVNQDPSMEIVFDHYLPTNQGTLSTLVMTGYVLDPNHRIAGAQWAGNNVVQNVTVNHTLSLTNLDRFLTATTTVSNHGTTTLGIRNIGDFLYQQGGGYRFAIPATYDAAGAALAKRWGVEIPGSDFSNPLGTAVKAPMVGLMDPELASPTLDSHASLGFLPVDGDNLLVTSDPQSALSDLRPIFPQRLVVGSIPTSGLPAGSSISFTRRIYISGGPSTSTSYPGMVNWLFNTMDQDRFKNLRAQDWGWFQFSLTGSAQRQGPLPAEIRIEKNVGSTATPVWELARLEWMEPNNNATSTGGLAGSGLAVALPVGSYRMVVRNRVEEQIKTTFMDINDADRSLLPQPITIRKDLNFVANSSEPLCPEAARVANSMGAVYRNLYSVHYFSTRERDAPAGSLQPLRITLVGLNGTPDPVMRRQVTVGSYFDATTKGPQLAPATTAGQYQVRGGNEMFGTGFTNYLGTEFAWLPNPEPGGVNSYRAYGTRGPLSSLESLDLAAYDGQSDNAHSFVIWPAALPTGWTSFDVPGPSQATTGGFNPGEKLASAMAEGVQVVGHVEQDLQVDAPSLYSQFRSEFGFAGFTDAMKTAIGNDPFVVGGRSSSLAGYGTVTALFTPAATGIRYGGARRPSNWTLSDFLQQSEGQFQVVNRPRGPQGLFTQRGFNPAVALGQGANAWWKTGGLYSFGRVNGGFDGLELLRGEGFDGANPDPWFQEFLLVRADWFAILNQQVPTAFTKALGLSSAKYSMDTPVGLARTYLKTTPTTEDDLTGVLAALKSGAAVASTGPFLDVAVGAAGPGALVPGPVASVSLTVNLTRTPWMPVDELRVVVNGTVVRTINPATLTQSSTDSRVWSGTFSVTMPTGKDAWIVVEAGVPLTTKGVYAPGSPWNRIMRGIYPIAVTNPIFVDVTGGGYTAPML